MEPSVVRALSVVRKLRLLSRQEIKVWSGYLCDAISLKLRSGTITRVPNTINATI